MAHHVRHLVFGGITITSYRLLDPPGSVLYDRNIARQSSGHHNPLRPAQLEHGLNVLPKKRIFDSHFIGVVFIDQAKDGFVEFLELQLVGRIFAQLNDAILNHGHDARFHRDNTVTGYLRTGVYAENDFLFSNVGGFRRNKHNWGVVFLQGNVFSSVLSLKSGKKIIFWVKTAVFAGLLAYIGYVLWQQPFNWAVVRSQLSAVEHPEQWAAGLFLLTPVNWGFEALKWQILLQRIEKATYWQAYKGVLAGVALGFALPALLGDTAGRVLSLHKHRAEAVGASLVSGGMQFYVAVVFGTVAWAHHITVVPVQNNLAGQWLLILLLALSMGGVVFGLVRQRLIRWLADRPSMSRFSEYWNVAGLYSDREIGLALCVAAFRYVVFSVQFYLAMRLVGIHLSKGLSASSIGLVFLVKTVTPAFNLLSDLGVREAASLWVFEPFAQTSATVSTSVLLTATLTLWVANVLTPVLVGLIWVWKLKLTTE